MPESNTMVTRRHGIFQRWRFLIPVHYKRCYANHNLRVNLVKGIGPVLQLAEGWTADLPEKMNKILTDRTDPGWPTTWFTPRLTGQGPFTDVYSVMANWGANHSASSYGHIGADIITLASMLRIPVCMHNIP